MRTPVALLLFLSLAATAFAEPIRPFLGFGANINQTDDHYMQVEKQHWAAMKLPKHDGLNMQVEAGITTGSYSAYLGYRSGSSSHDDSKSYEIFEPGLEYIKYTKSEITSGHFVFGTRVEPVLKFMPEFLKPVVGLGLTYGKAEKETEWDDTYVTSFFPDTTYNTESFSEKVETDDAFGGLLQFGFAFEPAKLPFQVFVMYEVHAYQARFEDVERWSPTADQYEIRENGFKLGLTYRFGKLGGE